MRNPNHLKYIKALYVINEPINTTIEYGLVKQLINETGINASFSEKCLNKEQRDNFSNLSNAIEELKKLKEVGYRNSAEILDSFIFKYHSLEHAFNESFEKQKSFIVDDILRIQKSDYERSIDYLNSGDINKVEKAIETLESLDSNSFDIHHMLAEARKKYQVLKRKKILKTVLILCCVAVLGCGLFFAVEKLLPNKSESSGETIDQTNIVSIFDTEFSMPKEWLIEKNADGSTVTIYFRDKNESIRTKEYMTLEIMPDEFMDPPTYESAVYCLNRYGSSIKEISERFDFLSKPGNPQSYSLNDKLPNTPILKIYTRLSETEIEKNEKEIEVDYVMMINEKDALRIEYWYDPNVSSTRYDDVILDILKTAKLSYGSLPRT